MLTRFRSLRPGDAAGLVILGAVVALVLTGTASAITDSSFTYSTTQTGRLTIHPMDLAPDGNVAAESYKVSYSAASLQAGSSSCFNTGVNLPQGASITNVQTYYRSGTGSNLAVLFVRNELGSDATSSLVSAIVADDSSVRKAVSHVPGSTVRVVNNNLYSYGYGICVGPSTTFEGTRITYEYRSAGD